MTTKADGSIRSCMPRQEVEEVEYFRRHKTNVRVTTSSENTVEARKDRVSKHLERIQSEI